MDKYLGESDKMVSAIFRVARKLAPTVVFIDEIDTVLRKRGGDMNNSHVQSMQVSKLMYVIDDTLVLLFFENWVTRRKDFSLYCLFFDTF